MNRKWLLYSTLLCLSLPPTVLADRRLYKMRGLSTNMIASSSRPISRLFTQSRPILAHPALIRNASSRSQSPSPTKPSLNVGSASGGPQDPLAYCSSLVQRLDPEAWLTSYFWKGRERAWFLAWRAFNVCPQLTILTITFGDHAIMEGCDHSGSRRRRKTGDGC